eukprot:PhM_4_TR18803/c3_g1_i1/m.91594
MSVANSSCALACEPCGVEITQAEYNNFRRMFRTFDHDGSGTIDEDELTEVVKALGIALDEATLKELMVGRAGDDGLDFDGYLALMLDCKRLMPDNTAVERDAHIQTVTKTDRLLPDAPWRWGLDSIIFMGIVYYAVAVPWRDVRPETFGHVSAVVFEWFMSVVMLTDLALNFFTLAEDPETGDDVESLHAIARIYLRSWFGVDFLSAFPFDLLIGRATVAGTVFHHLRLLKIIKLYAMFRFSSRRSFTPAMIVLATTVVPVCRLLFWLIVVIHIYNVVWLYLSPSADYVEAGYLVLYTITTVGLGDVEVTSQAQRIFNCVLFISGAFVNGFVISKLSHSLQKASVQQEKNEKMTEMVSLLRYFNIPLELQEEILAFQYHQLERDLSTAYRQCIDGLPPTMQDQLSMYVRLDYVSKLPFCKDSHIECRMALARALFQTVFAPQEFIICAGEKGAEMYFLTHGFADVLSGVGKYVVTLKRGDFFGEYSLMYDGMPRSASVKALTYCDTLTLERMPFLDILNRYPNFKRTVQRQVEEHHGKRANAAPPPTTTATGSAGTSAVPTSPQTPISTPIESPAEQSTNRRPSSDATLLRPQSGGNGSQPPSGPPHHHHLTTVSSVNSLTSMNPKDNTNTHNNNNSNNLANNNNSSSGSMQMHGQGQPAWRDSDTTANVIGAERSVVMMRRRRNSTFVDRDPPETVVELIGHDGPQQGHQQGLFVPEGAETLSNSSVPTPHALGVAVPTPLGAMSFRRRRVGGSSAMVEGDGEVLERLVDLGRRMQTMSTGLQMLQRDTTSELTSIRSMIADIMEGSQQAT